MKMKRIICIVLAALMAIALIPIAAAAEEISSSMSEARAMKRWDDVWAVLDSVEAEMMANGANRAEVTYAVYKAALNCPLIDKGSITDLNDNEFSFTTDGMWGGYNYRVRNFTKAPARASSRPLAEASETVARVSGVKNSTDAIDILLVEPYYGTDGSFTDQYIQEAYSLASCTGGTATILQQSNASGPKIASNYLNKGIVIYDSHGNCIGSKQTSYLDLTTNSGLTQEDYSNGWAYNGGSFWGIDGRYIKNHVNGTLSNCFVWMAICEGMKRAGKGTTGTALIEAGAAAVYGYSQSVTFAGDYKYERTFWNAMKDGAYVFEALEEMKAKHGIPDPYGDAYPILMSPVDPFPSNPDGAQTVYCDWTMYPPTQLQSWSLESSLTVYKTFTESLEFNRVPTTANCYELEWYSEDETIASVQGNDRRASVTGVNEGVTKLWAYVYVGETLIGKGYCRVTVLPVPTLKEAVNIPGGQLDLTTSGSYPWQVAIVDGAPVAASGNAFAGNSESKIQLVLQMKKGEKLSFDWMASTEEDYDYFKFYVNGDEYAYLTGETDWANYIYTAPSDGTYTFAWNFEKDPYEDGITDRGYLRNVDYICEYTVGDVNNDGSIDSNDALIILRYSLMLQPLTGSQKLAADANGDGKVTSSDALLILRSTLA